VGRYSMKIKRNSRDAQTEPMDAPDLPKRLFCDLQQPAVTVKRQETTGLLTPISVRDPVVLLRKPRTAMSLSRLTTKDQANSQEKTPKSPLFPFNFQSFYTPKRPFVSSFSPLSPDYSRNSLKALLAALDTKTPTSAAHHSEISPLFASYESHIRPIPGKVKAIRPLRRTNRPSVPSTGLGVRKKQAQKPLTRRQQSQESLSSWKVTEDM
jgi:hypothetical protein